MSKKRKATGVVLAEDCTEAVAEHIVAMVHGQLPRHNNLKPYLHLQDQRGLYAVHCEFGDIPESDSLWVWLVGYCTGILREIETREMETADGA